MTLSSTAEMDTVLTSLKGVMDKWIVLIRPVLTLLVISLLTGARLYFDSYCLPDEFDCELFTIDSSYLKTVPPSPPSKGELARVYIGFDILSILEISEVSNFINLQMVTRLSWRDERLTMLNLKEDEDLNTLTPEFRSKLWMPEVVFYNTEEKLESLNDGKAFATIRRDGSFTRSDEQALRNSYIFRGEDNPITLSRVYSAPYLCNFNMQTYPFDTQKCSIILIMKVIYSTVDCIQCTVRAAAYQLKRAVPV